MSTERTLGERIYRWSLCLLILGGGTLALVGCGFLLYAMTLSDTDKIVAYGIAGWMLIAPGGALAMTAIGELNA